ncbi:hypothetical protein DEO72_LG7g581 [Vigna unguiculata]|uniref:Uncharacterized protein n=1 Tax=Vigna unguiculata TaxID=3917 RepID=A0A4D6MEY1_VIGUN|nr:hypothetical protein DEO72_LG7g581 [Vigna unguiculata]
MQDLNVNCGRIREELDWTTERQEKELYKLVKEDVRQEEKKGNLSVDCRPTEAPYGTRTKPVRSKGELPRKPRSNKTDPSGRPRLPTGPEPSLFDQRASFLESPVRTGPTQAVKRNPDRADRGSLRDLNQACSIKGRASSKAPFEQDRPKRSNETPIGWLSTNLAKNSFSMSMGRWADRSTEAPSRTRTKLVRSKGELSRKPHVNSTDPSGQTEAR